MKRVLYVDGAASLSGEDYGLTLDNDARGAASD
jgi:hypothetical protein